MKNIILQHFDSKDLRPLDKLSSKNIEKYAHGIGADYRLIIGYPFRKGFTSPIQKLYMLDEEFDCYDTVVMLDIDMFTRTGMNENVFDIKGIGLHEPIQNRLIKKLVNTYPHISNINYPYWGGAIYKLDKEARQILRSNLGSNEEWMQHYNKRYHWGDEGIMHTLAYKANFKPSGPYLDKRWCHGSFETGIENASLIHIRTKVAPSGPKRLKIDNYRDLVKRGLIEE